MTPAAATARASAARWCSAALALLEKNRLEEALHALHQAVRLDTSCAPAWNDLGVLLEALGNRRDAVHCYRAALRAQPGMREAAQNLAALAAQAAARTDPPPPVRNRAVRAKLRQGG